jgi:hypothetical protein
MGRYSLHKAAPGSTPLSRRFVEVRTDAARTNPARCYLARALALTRFVSGVLGRLLHGKGRRVHLFEAIHRAAGSAVCPDWMDGPAARVNTLVVAVLVAKVRARDGLIRRS